MSNPENQPSAAAPERLALFLDLQGRKVLVVGGGPIGTRRAHSMLASGAHVTVVAPEVTDELAVTAHAGDPALTWHARPFTPHDLAGCWLVHIATGDRAVDAAVANAAEAAGVWAIVASDHRSSPAWMSAATEAVDGVRVAVSAGGDPVRAQQVRDDITAGLRDGTLLGPRRRVRGTAGRVWLVGAGPGDPDLLTVRARRVLRLADMVLSDHLIPAAMLDALPAGVHVVDVGKRAGAHAMAQGQINDLLVALASEGKFVVRLKGGDPFVFGRGGEEALACIAAGIPVEVVPGITSAIAVPAATGIPVTHRGVADAFTVVSGHLGWDSISDHVGAPDPTRTIVILMGMRALEDIAQGFVASGWDPATPVAVIAQGWTQAQRMATGTLATITNDASVQQLGAPAIIVVGSVATLHEQLGEVGAWSPNAAHRQPPP